MFVEHEHTWQVCNRQQAVMRRMSIALT